MKKLWILLLLLLLPAYALADEPFTIDDGNLYKGMNRTYLQGYAPTVKNKSLTVILPLNSDVVAGEITALLTPQDIEYTPFKLQDFELQVAPKNYTFGVSYTLALHDDRANGEYPFTITMSGKDAKGDTYYQDFTLEAVITDGAYSPPPALQISGAKISGAYLVAGEEAILTLTVTNPSPYRAAEDVTISFNDSMGDIFPIGSNITRIGRIPVGGRHKVEIPLTVNAKAQSGAHAATCSVSYADLSANSTETSAQITLDVRQTVRFEHSDPFLPTRVTHGDIPSFSITLMNMGKSKLYNVLMTFDIEGLSSGGSVLVGTIDSGSSAYGSANFKVDTAVVGDVSGNVSITYEDEYGTVYEKILPLKTTVAEKVALSAMANGTQEAADDALLLSAWIGWGVAALLLLALIAQSIRLTRKISRIEERDL